MEEASTADTSSKEGNPTEKSNNRPNETATANPTNKP